MLQFVSAVNAQLVLIWPSNFANDPARTRAQSWAKVAVKKALSAIQTVGNFQNMFWDPADPTGPIVVQAQRDRETEAPVWPAFQLWLHTGQ